MIRAVSVVIPVFNGERTIDQCLGAVERQLPPDSEVIVVDDGGSDRSIGIVRGRTRSGRLRIITGRGLGVAAALNDGILAARHPVICQIDQDVVIHDRWFERVLPMLEATGVAAVQGRFSRSCSSRVLARCAALELSARYAEIKGDAVDHVCTGNTAYKVDALRAIGLFDESLAYGDDNDVSYRLVSGGFKLRFCRAATATHAWPETIAGYMRQQYGLGSGRLDVVAKHPHRVSGDAVSGPGMVIHAAAAFAGCVLLPISWKVAGAIFALLALERGFVAVRTWRRFGDTAGLALPAVHLLRDLVWAYAIARWIGRRLARQRPSATDSMARTRSRTPQLVFDPAVLPAVVAIIPAFNEGSALPTVIADLRACWPELRILVVDDGSDDGTFAAAVRLGCDTLRLPLRLGVGSAVRAGIRYARELGYDTVVRVDGDGQHAASEIPRVLAPVLSGKADAAAGARTPGGHGALLRSLSRVCLSVALIPFLRRALKDPTSGFWAFGPRATRLLARQHPTGYPEPELHLLLRRERLLAVEVPISSRERVAGKTSLTAWRAALALWRALLAMVVVPLRPSGERPR